MSTRIIEDLMRRNPTTRYKNDQEIIDDWIMAIRTQIPLALPDQAMMLAELLLTRRDLSELRGRLRQRPLNDQDVMPYLKEQVEILRRTAERGMANAHKNGSTESIDTFQHLLDEIQRVGNILAT